MNQERRAQWLRGVLDLCVLALLSRGESYGYELSQALRTYGLGTVQGGTLYPVLLRLQRAGLLTAHWREGETGPARKYYRISPAGSAALHAAVIDWSAFTASVGAILSEEPKR
ncbi:MULTISPECIES: PadR family transcriptional regulator [unclassified Micromonospora]|uniref:PadR family transcriptional regulator n=1 Tax=unclassified Micromonospora TaxID=2617518 RepID=UPI00105185F1|nr:MULTISPECIES: PadR family transcriptional regulator [unclassified Micromonospora]TDB74592.1 PadR family transcriptional regulator [Micromonospora sp. KC721]TDC43978.1 PadR family transcriptional regulator [Micromonospora sp. KC213]